MKTELNILTECFVDTLIVKSILYQKKGFNHRKGCNEVLKINDKFADQAAFGIIDDDKIVPKAFKDFSLLKKHNEQLSIYKCKDKPHFIVKIGKAAEDFIIKNAEKCNIRLSEYNLPSELEKLKKRTKQINSMQDTDFKRLFSALLQHESSDFCKLAQWIELFISDPYNFNIELL